MQTDASNIEAVIKRRTVDTRHLDECIQAMCVEKFDGLVDGAVASKKFRSNSSMDIRTHHSYLNESVTSLELA